MTAMKCGARFPFAVLDGEVLLVMLHHHDEHFFRQGEELRIEVAEDRGRVFGEVDQRVFESGVGPGVRVKRGDLGANLLAARGGGEQDEIVFEDALVVLVSDGNSGFAQDAVTVRGVARADSG